MVCDGGFVLLSSFCRSVDPLTFFSDVSVGMGRPSVRLAFVCVIHVHCFLSDVFG